MFAHDSGGETLEIGHLFQGFRDQERLGPLVLLGAISLAGYVLMALVVMVVEPVAVLPALLPGVAPSVPEHATSRRQAEAAIGENDLFTFIYTSGTTGPP